MPAEPGGHSRTISFWSISHRRFYRSQGAYPRFGARPGLPFPKAKVKSWDEEGAIYAPGGISEVDQTVSICQLGTVGKWANPLPLLGQRIHFEMRSLFYHHSGAAIVR